MCAGFFFYCSIKMIIGSCLVCLSLLDPLNCFPLICKPHSLKDVVSNLVLVVNKFHKFVF